MTAVVDTDPASAPGVRAGAFGNATHLICRECGATTALGPFYACTECFGPLEVGYEFPTITRERIEAGPRSIWRYAPLLPVPADIATFRSTDPGFTRLVDARHLADDLGLKQLWVKDDSGNPTHSFKDRVVAVALSAARELGFQVLACPSTGNLANAVAAAAARAGIKSVVLVPSNLERQKILASAIYDTTLIAIEGTYDDVNKLASEIAAEQEGWAFVNVNVRPYYAEGSKTLGYEIAEQLGWRLPDQVVIPVASGAQLTKIDKGFRELIKLGARGGQAVCDLRCAGNRLLASGTGIPRRPGLRGTGEASHYCQVIGYRQPRRWAVRARCRAAYGRSGRRCRRRDTGCQYPASGAY
jgi:threonine synthase